MCIKLYTLILSVLFSLELGIITKCSNKNYSLLLTQTISGCKIKKLLKELTKKFLSLSCIIKKLLSFLALANSNNS